MLTSYDLNSYQQDALRTARVDPEAPLLRIDIARDGLGLTGEAGEVADILKKYIGHGHALDREKVVKELGDVLWYVAVLAHRMGWTLEDVALVNIEKLRKRYPDGFSSERSINRTDEAK